MNCQKCGAQIPEGAKFCTNCGAPVVEPKHAAKMSKRLINFFLDIIGGFIFNILVAIFVLNFLSNNQYVYLPLAVLLYFNIIYYCFFESIWQRTPAKWLTRTKVVRLDGSKPHFLQIVGRSFSRLIPFEIFSFVFGEHPYGWHDRISKTMVVPAEYSVEEAAAINPNDKGKSSTTGVVLALIFGGLFFIVVVGILAGIVLASLGSARNKAQESHVTLDMHQLAISSFMYEDEHGSYQGFCTDHAALGVPTEPLARGPLPDASFAARGDLTSYVCNDSAEHWAATVPLTWGYVCMDDVLSNSTGEPRVVSEAIVAETSCASLPSYQEK